MYLYNHLICYLPVQSTSEKTVPETNTSTDPIYWLDRLSAILRHLATKTNNEKDPCVVAIVEVCINIIFEFSFICYYVILWYMMIFLLDVAIYVKNLHKI